MHILIIPSWYPDVRKKNDTYGIFFKELAEAFAARGHRISVLAGLIPFPFKPWNIGKFLFKSSHSIHNRVDTFYVRYFNCSRLLPLKEKSVHKAATAWFAKYIKKYGTPDVIHAHSVFQAGIIAHVISEKYTIPYYISEHGSLFLKGLTEEQSRVAFKVFQNAWRYTTVSSGLMEHLVTTLQLDRAKGKIIPNMLNELFIRSTPSEVKNDKFVFLHIALDGKNKRRDLLLEAFSLAFRETNDVFLHFGGTVKENESILKYAEKLNLSDKVKIVGRLNREDVLKLIQGCHVFVLSSDHETFGIVLIEALSQGKPVISTDSGGPGDIIKDKNGLLVPTNNIKDLAIAMQQMKRDYTGYHSNEIRTDCLNMYHPDVIINQYLELFKE